MAQGCIKAGLACHELASSFCLSEAFSDKSCDGRCGRNAPHALHANILIGHNARGRLAWRRSCDAAAVEAKQTACSEQLWVAPQRLSGVLQRDCIIMSPHATRQDANLAHCPNLGKWARLAK